MQIAQENLAMRRQDVNDFLYAAFSMGLPQAFDIEWLIDRAERRKWSGSWS